MDVKQVIDCLLTLLRFEMNGAEGCCDIKTIKNSDGLSALFRLSKKHDLVHLVADALDKNGLLIDGSEAKKRFLQERNMAVYRYEQQQYELDQICAVLQQLKVPFIPLKGALIRTLYPQPWMRTSCDIDILVKEEDLPRAIDALTTALNYQYGGKNNHDVSLFAESGVHLELHYKLNDSNQGWDSVLGSVWDYAEAEENFRYVLTKEMFYFYHIAHMAGHFKFGGCGVRSVLDLFLLRKYISYNQDALADLLKQGGLTAFNEAVCALSDYWFGGGNETPLVLELNDFILNAGMYGDVKNRVTIAKVKKGGRLKALFSRVFLPYNKLKFQYPILQKHKILVPFYQVKRWFNLLDKDRRKQSVYELKATIQENEETTERITKLLKHLDI